jgi:acyl-CoA synthetase (AMP-forming)/AMP-acid ligase II
MVAGLFLPAQTGAKTVFMSQFDLELFLTLIQEHKVTRGHVVPPIALALAKHPMVDNFDLSSLESMLSGAAPLGGEIQRAASQRLNCIFKQAWGMTELSPGGSFTPDDVLRPKGFAGGEEDWQKNIDQIMGKSGPLLPATEGKIVHPETGEDLASTATGELLIRGPQVMKGYLKNPEATEATLTSDGWLKTGDIGNFTEEGWLIITDRNKELIKYKGFQVPPAELEALLLTMPEISDAVVIPVEDDEAGELPCAYVVKNEATLQGKELTEQQVQDYVAERVAPHKRLRGGVRFADSIPKSASGKILRRVQKQIDRGEL